MVLEKVAGADFLVHSSIFFVDRLTGTAIINMLQSKIWCTPAHHHSSPPPKQGYSIICLRLTAAFAKGWLLLADVDLFAALRTDHYHVAVGVLP